MSDFDRGPFIDQSELDAAGRPAPEGVELPTRTDQAFPLTDDDAGECRTIGEDELSASYVDNNIVTIEPMQGDPWSREASVVDNQDLRVAYADGRQFAVRLGSISLDAGPAPADFRKSGGVIYATDSSGNPLFDATNTPQLSFIRRHFHEQLQQISDQVLEIAMIVYVFSQAVAAAGQSVNTARFNQPPGVSWTWTGDADDDD